MGKSVVKKQKITVKKQKRGRKPFIFDEKVLKKIEKLAMDGHTNDDIAACIGVNRSTFYKNIKTKKDLKDTLKRGQAKGAVVVGNKLMGLCRKGNLGAIIWYEKTRCGRTDKIDVNNTGTVTHKHEGLSRSLELLEGYKVGRGASKPDEDPLPN